MIIARWVHLIWPFPALHIELSCVSSSTTVKNKKGELELRFRLGYPLKSTLISILISHMYLSSEMNDVLNDNRNQHQNKTNYSNSPCRRLLQRPSSGCPSHFLALQLNKLQNFLEKLSRLPKSCENAALRLKQECLGQNGLRRTNKRKIDRRMGRWGWLVTTRRDFIEKKGRKLNKFMYVRICHMCESMIDLIKRFKHHRCLWPMNPYRFTVNHSLKSNPASINDHRFQIWWLVIEDRWNGLIGLPIIDEPTLWHIPNFWDIFLG